MGRKMQNREWMGRKMQNREWMGRKMQNQVSMGRIIIKTATFTESNLVVCRKTGITINFTLNNFITKPHLQLNGKKRNKPECS